MHCKTFSFKFVEHLMELIQSFHFDLDSISPFSSMHSLEFPADLSEDFCGPQWPLIQNNPVGAIILVVLACDSASLNISQSFAKTAHRTLRNSLIEDPVFNLFVVTNMDEDLKILQEKVFMNDRSAVKICVAFCSILNEGNILSDKIGNPDNLFDNIFCCIPAAAAPTLAPSGAETLEIESKINNLNNFQLITCENENDFQKIDEFIQSVIYSKMDVRCANEKNLMIVDSFRIGYGRILATDHFHQCLLKFHASQTKRANLHSSLLACMDN